MEEARQEKLQSVRNVESLRKRRSREVSTRFPTLPRMLSAATSRAFIEIRSKFRKLSKTKSKYAQQRMDTTSIDHQLDELMSHARSMVDTVVTNSCEAHGVQQEFPHLRRTHPKFDSLSELRKAHRRLWDRLRKNNAREDLVVQDAEIIRQAWELVRGAPEQ